MHTVFAPHLNREVSLGGMRPPKHGDLARVPTLKSYLKSTPARMVPPSPASCAWNAAAMSVLTDPEGNTRFGDCVLAEEAHFIALVTGNTGKLFAYSEDQTLAAYSLMTGFDKNNPQATDNGTDPLVCLDWFVKNPYADGSQNLGYVLVDASNQGEVQFALSLFGNLKLWLCLPDSYVNPFPSGHDFVWDVAPPNANNGHCIGGCGYVGSGPPPACHPRHLRRPAILGISAAGVQIMTWGLLGTLTWPALAQLCVPSAGGGCAVRVTKDWVSAQGETPSGLNLTQMLADFTQIGGVVVAPIAAPPFLDPGSAPNRVQPTIPHGPNRRGRP